MGYEDCKGYLYIYHKFERQSSQYVYNSDIEMRSEGHWKDTLNHQRTTVYHDL